MKRSSVILAVIMVAIVAGYVFLPFGPIPKPPSPNCGPEQWRWLGESFNSTQAVLGYLQAHEMELLIGSHTPRLGGFPSDWVVGRMNMEIDWESIEADIQVQKRLGYTVYTLKYNHPACSKSQYYTFKVTSYGLASLYGCCGV